ARLRRAHHRRLSRCDGGHASLCSPYESEGASGLDSSDLTQIRSHLGKHAAKHLWGQHAGVGVVARAVIAVVELESTGPMHGTMRKRRRRAAKAQRLQD